MATQRATLFDPKTGKRLAVEVGSRQASDLFGQGYKLETATQNYQTYQNPQREIQLGSGNNLVAVDKTAGTQTPISGPRELTGLVNSGGYQDTRRSLDLAPPQNMQTNQYADTRSLPGAAPGAPMKPAVNPGESFQYAIAQLLRQAQQSNTGDEDLLKQRNALIQARFNSVNNPTAEDLRVLSPDQQASLRGGDVRSLETQLSGVNTALQGRERQRGEARELAQQAHQMLKDFEANERATRDDARQLVNQQFQLFGSDAFGSASAEDLARLEGQAGLPRGTLSSQKKTLKEREMDEKAAQASQTKYAPGSIGEYQFAVENGYQGTYTDYQNEDANRKAVIAGTGGGSLPNSYKEWQLAGSPGSYADWVKKTGDNGKPPTAEQFKAATFAERTMQADQILTQLESKFIGNKSIVGGLLPNALQSGERQQFEQAKRNFINAVLRRESGASISPSEFGSADKQYFAQPGDTQQTLDQKKITRNIAIQGLVREAGNALSPISGGSQGGGDPLDDALKAAGFKSPLSMGVKGSEVKKIAQAIGQFESGGNYKAIGPNTGKQGKALGRYQIMETNVPSWSKEALGYSITPQQFLANPKLQDAIAEYKMAQYYQKYGTVEDVASVWFSGRPLAKAGNAKDVIGTSVPKYVKNVRSIYNSLG